VRQRAEGGGRKAEGRGQKAEAGGLRGGPAQGRRDLCFAPTGLIEETMQFGHEQFDVYRVSPEYAVRESWAPYGDYDHDNDHDNECPCLWATFAFFARENQPPRNPVPGWSFF